MDDILPSYRTHVCVCVCVQIRGFTNTIIVRSIATYVHKSRKISRSDVAHKSLRTSLSLSCSHTLLL
jgi:hypothetical protein